MKIVILFVSLFLFDTSFALTLSTPETNSVGATTLISPAPVGGTVVSAKDINAETRDCQVENGPTVIMYGLCYKEGNTVIFKSCAEFTCKIDKDVVAGPIDAKQESCFADKDPVKFKAAALVEHNVKKVSEIKDCGYGEKRKPKGEK